MTAISIKEITDKIVEVAEENDMELQSVCEMIGAITYFVIAEIAKKTRVRNEN